MVGQGSAGSGLGNSLGAALSRWLGSGDYTVAENSIVQKTMKGSASIPAMHRTDQTIVVRHREFIQSISSSTNYAVRADLRLNPGLSQTFPWLSAIAANFQEYKIKGLVFHYVPTSGMATGSNTALGSVMIQTAYRATDSTPGTKYELLNEFWSNECMPSEAMVHPLECKTSESVLSSRYIRDGATTDDLMFYDYGRTTVAVQGQQTSGQIVGDLWVTYEVELKKPRLFATLGRAVRSLRASTTTATVLRPYNGMVITDNSFVGDFTLSSLADNTFRLNIPAGNAGSYIWTTILVGTTLTSSGVPVAAGTNTTVMLNEAEGVAGPTLATSGIRSVLTVGFFIGDPTTGSSIEVTGVTHTAVALSGVYAYVTASDRDYTTVL